MDQYCTVDGKPSRDRNLKWITFDFAGNRANHGQVSFSVECDIGYYHGRTCACLLMSQHRIEIKIDEIAAFWNVSGRGRLPGFLADRFAPIN